MDGVYTKDRKFKMNTRFEDNEYDYEKNIVVTLLNQNEKGAYEHHIGHLFIKIQDEEIKITDFIINYKYRSNGYGIEMIKEAVKCIESKSIEGNRFYGQISGVDLEDFKYTKKITDSSDYKKLRAFYEKLGFIFLDDTTFEKRLENVDFKMWEHLLDVTQENKRLEDIIVKLHDKNTINEQHIEKTKELEGFLHSNILGKFVLKLYKKV
ncbi:hypothetical protein AALK46_12690 [Staphylococcus nepalensis]|uniref:hypothetical protein n=1 Tax=Staphylococcus nepalensis TaxID=214473 RepID=UPI003519CC55